MTEPNCSENYILLMDLFSVFGWEGGQSNWDFEAEKLNDQNVRGLFRVHSQLTFSCSCEALRSKATRSRSSSTSSIQKIFSPTIFLSVLGGANVVSKLLLL